MVKKVNDFEHLDIYRYHISFTFLTQLGQKDKDRLIANVKR